jgi:hypothetical protein
MTTIDNYKNLSEDTLWALCKQGKASRTHKERYDRDGYYIGTNYTFHLPTGEEIKSFFHWSLINQ